MLRRAPVPCAASDWREAARRGAPLSRRSLALAELKRFRAGSGRQARVATSLTGLCPARGWAIPARDAPSLSRRRLGLHLPRLSSPAAAHQQARRSRSARSMAIRRCCGSSPTSSHKADGPTHMAVILDASSQDVPQRHVRPVQGAPAAAARGSGPAIPDDPRRHPRLLAAVHRGRGAGGRRHHRLLCQGGAGAGLEGDDRQLRQGSDAADRAGRSTCSTR